MKGRGQNQPHLDVHLRSLSGYVRPNGRVPQRVETEVQHDVGDTRREGRQDRRR